MFTTSLPKTIFRLVVVLLLLGFGAWSFWKYQQAQRQVELLSDPEAQAAIVLQERQELIAKVAALMVLPEGEEPLIFDIENAAAMAEVQPFFLNTSDGDKVLIYSQAGISIIYSPSKDIIVNVGTLTVGTADPVEEATPAAEE